MRQKWGRTVLQYGHRITQRLWTEVGIFHGHADGALCTEAEVSSRTRGKAFTDPWPQTQYRVT